MKKIYTFLFLLLALGLNAQLTFDEDGEKQFGFGSDGEEQIMVTYLDAAAYKIPKANYSNSSDTYSVTWEAIPTELPQDWELQICDNVTCYLSGVYGNTITIDKNTDQAYLAPQVTVPTSNPFGTATIDLVLKNADSGEVEDMLTYTITIDEWVTSVEVLRKEINIYPNPVTSSLNIDFVNYENVSSVEIYNLVGRQIDVVEVLNTNETFTYNAYDLNEGMYLVHLLDNNGHVVGTKRFSKVN